MHALMLAIALASAPTIRSVGATSYLGIHSGTSLYAAAQLFDGDDRTAWCEGVPGDGAGERIVVEFARAVRIDRVRVALGDSLDFGGFEPANRPKRITLSNLGYNWELEMPDSAEPFELPLPPPLRGRQVVVRVDETYDHHARQTRWWWLAGLGRASFRILEGRPVLRLAGPFAGYWVPWVSDVGE